MNGLSTPSSQPQKQSILLKDRSSLHIDGVNEVLSFDDRNIFLDSNFGTLSVEGKGLKILNLSTDDGELQIEGSVDGIFFFDETVKEKKKRFFRKS